jgi:putative glutamine amidotransferase
VLAGGGDVYPARYGAELHPCTDPAQPERGASELALVHAALARGLPLLAVCPGPGILLPFLADHMTLEYLA